MHFANLVWRVSLAGRYKFSALSLESAMAFIGRFERGEFSGLS